MSRATHETELLQKQILLGSGTSPPDNIFRRKGHGHELDDTMTPIVSSPHFSGRDVVPNVPDLFGEIGIRTVGADAARGPRK
jgi:hypothetical protein